MYLINDMPPQVDQDLLDLLAQCRTETIGHHRHWGFVHGDIKAVMGERAIVGTAVTVLCPGHDMGMVPHAIGSIRPGDVLFIDRLGDDHHACWGGGTTLAAQVAGAAGVVIDGRATGTSKFREYDLPAWIRGYSPVGGHPYAMGGAFNISVSVGGTAVPPGCAVLADESGILALPLEDVRYLAEMASKKQEGQAEGLEKMRQGLKPGDRLGITEKILAGAAQAKAARLD